MACWANLVSGVCTIRSKPSLLFLQEMVDRDLVTNRKLVTEILNDQFTIGDGGSPELISKISIFFGIEDILRCLTKDKVEQKLLSLNPHKSIPTYLNLAIVHSQSPWIFSEVTSWRMRMIVNLIFFLLIIFWFFTLFWKKLWIWSAHLPILLCILFINLFLEFST